jgi:predicted ATPase
VRQSSALSILVTSRETLGPEGGHVLTLEGLAVPPTVDVRFEDYGATRLVLELCNAKGVDVTTQKQAVLELCRVVGGLPLALKLAAPYFNVLSVAELMQQLQADLEFLTHDKSEGKQRHANIRTVFDLSFHKLNPTEQLELSGLAVFEGKFSFASVNSILKVSLRTLRRFVEMSLLRAYPSEACYDLHPLLKQYLREKAQPASERWQHLRADHAAYYLAQLARTDAAQQRETRERLGGEATNVFAAWRYKVSQGDWATLYELAPSLETFCDETAQQSEGLALFTQTMTSAKATGTWLGRMLACRAWLEMRLGQTLECQRHAQEALHLLGSDDAPSRSSCFIALASIYEEAGEFEAARDAFLSELDLHPEGSPAKVSALLNVATLYLQLGEYEHSREALAKAEAMSFTKGSPLPVRLEFIRSRLLTEQGETLQARVLLERLSQSAREETLEHWQKTIDMLLAQILLELGEVERSVWLARTLMMNHEKDRWLRAKMQLVLGDAAMLKSDTLQALRCYHESLKTVLPTRSVPGFLLRLSCLVKPLCSSGHLTLAERILAYCKDARNYRRMSFVDRRRIDEVMLQPQVALTASKDWHNLEPEEVAVLVVSDVDYILQGGDQGEGPLALVES